MSTLDLESRSTIHPAKPVSPGQIETKPETTLNFLKRRHTDDQSCVPNHVALKATVVKRRSPKIVIKSTKSSSSKQSTLGPGISEAPYPTRYQEKQGMIADPNEPKPPLNAYSLFYKEHKNLGASELKAMWLKLSREDFVQYTKMAEHDYDRYRAEYMEYLWKGSYTPLGLNLRPLEKGWKAVLIRNLQEAEQAAANESEPDEDTHEDHEPADDDDVQCIAIVSRYMRPEFLRFPPGWSMNPPPNFTYALPKEKRPRRRTAEEWAELKREWTDDN